MTSRENVREFLRNQLSDVSTADVAFRCGLSVRHARRILHGLANEGLAGYAESCGHYDWYSTEDPSDA